jgi:negative elongation factor B
VPPRSLSHLYTCPHQVEKYFEDVEASEQLNAKNAAGRRGKGNAGGAGVPCDEAESAGNALGNTLAEPYQVLGDAGIILRDPSAMHLLLATALRQVLVGASEGKLPRDLSQLKFLLRLLQLAVDSRTMLRDGR